MAFPTYQSGGTGSGTTTISITKPSGTSSGDLLVATVWYFASDTITPPTGLSLVRQDDLVSSYRLATYHKIADGTEGATLDFGVSPGSVIGQGVCVRVTGHDSGTAPTASYAEDSGGASVANPPSHTPAGGAKDFLWLEHALSLNSLFNTPWGSSSYTDAVNGGNAIASAYRQLNAASEDPGNMSMSANDFWQAHTISVFPAAGGGGGPTEPPNVTVPRTLMLMGHGR